MEFNVGNFKDVLKKATLNFSIESVQLRISEDKIFSNMISAHRDAITELNISNDTFKMKKGDECEFNFNQPNVNIMPFLNLIDDEFAEMTVKDEKVIITSDDKQKANIHFCSPEIVSRFESKLKNDLSYFINLALDEEMMESFGKIKKVGTKFGNIYFNVEDNVFNVETSDRSNRFSNSLKLNLLDISDQKDISLKFDFKTFINLLTIINSDYNDFSMYFSYVEKDNMGMLVASKFDETEKYYLMSSRMEGEI